MTRSSVFRFLIAPLTLVGILLVGYLVSRWGVDSGIERYGGDRVTDAVARQAHVVTWVHRDHPLQRLLTPASTIVEMEEKPGHCAEPLPSPLKSSAQTNATQALMPALSPAEEIEQRDYRGRVRFYTLFAIPAADVYFTCGGSSVSNGENSS